MLRSPIRVLVAAVVVAIVVLAGIRAASQQRGAQAALMICDWLNAGARPELVMGARTEAVLLDMRRSGSPVECVLSSSPHTGSVLTEVAIALRPRRGTAVGIRVAPLAWPPEVLGYFTLAEMTTAP